MTPNIFGFTDMRRRKTKNNAYFCTKSTKYDRKYQKETNDPDYKLKIHPKSTIDEDIDTLPAEICEASVRNTRKVNNDTQNNRC